MNYGFKPTFRLVPKTRSDADSSRRVTVEGKPSYSQEAASIVLGAEIVKLRQMRQEGLIRSDVPDEFTEEELETLYREVRNLRAEGLLE